MPIAFDNTYARLPSAFYERVSPTPVSAPRLIAFNRDLAETLGIGGDFFETEKGLEVFSGNFIPPGADPIATAYSGHQFGGFSPVLGDGRAILLGEVIGTDGIRRDIQLKGPGPTPYSRRGDGRSALGPVMREYLVSEAMAALGIPTTRALAAVWSGDRVYRETPEPGGVFTRVAKSHLRIGTVQYFSAREDFESLRILVDYTLARHYPDANETGNPALALLKGVMSQQASLIAKWMSVGFIHGVMNTDNMSLSGETIDYGPCAFMDGYNPARKYSYIDRGGRYAFANQPSIAHWNLTRLAEALLPLLADTEEKAITLAQDTLKDFPAQFEPAYKKVFCEKIGLNTGSDDAWEISQSLLDLMAAQEADFTLVYRHLSDILISGDNSLFLALFPDAAPLEIWLKEWQNYRQKARITEQEAATLMKSVNPIFIPRNHRIEEVIQAGRKGDFEPFHRLHQVLKRPFENQPEFAEFESPPQPHEMVAATFCGT